MFLLVVFMFRDNMFLSVQSQPSEVTGPLRIKHGRCIGWLLGGSVKITDNSHSMFSIFKHFDTCYTILYYNCNLVSFPYLKITMYNPHINHAIFICKPHNQTPVIMEINHTF